MVSLNNIMVIGNLGGDPEMRYTPQGVPLTTFTVAVNRFYNDANGVRQQETQWFRVVTFRQLAEQCNQYLTKGRRAYVEGRFQSRSWQGNDGQTRHTNEIVANRVLFLDRPSDAGAPREGAEPAEAESTEADDLPF